MIMCKILLLSLLSLLSMFSCSKEATTIHPRTDTPEELTSSSEELEGASLTCSSSTNNNLQCTNGSTIKLPATFPHSSLCNQCLTTVTGGLASVKCPNGLSFQFTIIQGPKGDTGAKGDTGSKGDKGDKGGSCSVSTDGWVSCTDGTKYKLLSGPKGDTGAEGRRGDSCSVKRNQLNQVVVFCTDGKEEILSSCSGDGCWSYGLKGNVYSLPVNTAMLPNFSLLTPEESVIVKQFDMFNRQASLGFPGLPHRLTWYGIRFTGYIELPNVPCDSYILRVTSDDGAKLYIDEHLIVSHDGLHAPSAKTGAVDAESGWHAIRIDWFQGPLTQIALALEISTDGGATFRLVAQDELRVQIQN